MHNEHDGQGEVRPGVQAADLERAVQARNSATIATRPSQQITISRPLAEVRQAAKRAIQERLDAVSEQKEIGTKNNPDLLPIERALNNLTYLNDLGTIYPEFGEYLRRAGNVKLTGFMCLSELYLADDGVMFTHSDHCGFSVGSPLTIQRLQHVWESGWKDNSLNKLANLDEEGILKRLARGIK